MQHAIAHSQVIEIDYFTQSRRSMESRPVEPIGLYFYSRHWHLIAWCRLREDFRDFRLDRIKHLSNTGAWFDQRSRGDLDTYLKQNRTQVPLERAEVVFESSVAPFTHNQRHWYGFIEQVVEKDGRVKMVFLAPSLEFLGRWLMSYTDAVRIVSPQALKDKMQHLLGELERSLT